VLSVLLLLVAAGLAGARAQQEERAAAPSFLERQLQSLVPGLRVEGLEGAWRAAPRARRITLADSQGTWLTIDSVRLNIAPTALLRGVLRLQGLEAERVTVTRLPVPDPAAPAASPDPGGGVLPSLPDLPIDLALDRLAVQRVELGASVLGQAIAFTLDGNGRLGDGRLAARLALRRLDAQGHATIELGLDPPADRLAATVALQEPAGGIGPSLLGVPELPLSLEASLEGPAAAGAALSLRGELGPEIAVSMQGRLRAAGDGTLGADLAGAARFSPLLPPVAAPLASPARFTLVLEKPGTTPVLTLERLSLDLPAGRAELAGSFDIPGEAPDLALRIALAGSEQFAALLPAGVGWTAASAEARIHGTLGAPRLTLQASPSGLTSGVAQADAVLGAAPRLAGTVVMPGPAFDVAIEGEAGRLSTRGSLADPLDVSAALTLPDLAVLGAGSTGALEAEARAGGTLANPSVTLAARSGRMAVAGRVLERLDLSAQLTTPMTAPAAEARLTAALDGTPIRAALRGRPEGAAALRLQEAEARIGETAAAVTASGLIDTATLHFDGRARLAANDLALLGRLAGIPGVAGRLNLTADLSPREGMQGFEARLDSPAVTLDGKGVADLSATAAGTPRAIAWSLRGSGNGDIPLGRFSSRGRLLLEDARRQLELAALEAVGAGETLRLVAPASISLRPDGAIEASGLAIAAQRGGRVQAAGLWGPERADVTATLTALPLTLAEPFLPDIQPRGTLSGQLRVTGTTARPEVRATLRGVGLSAGADWARGLPAIGLDAEARLDPTGAAEARAMLDAGSVGRLSATARLPQGFGASATIAATADGALEIAPLAAPFIAGGADRVTGRVTLALRADGPLSEPRPAGRLTLAGISYRNDAVGVRVSDIAGAVVADGRRLTLQGLRGRTAGGGTLGLGGTVDLDGPGLPVAMTFTARNARPLTSSLGTGVVDADLSLDGPLNGTAAGGSWATLSGNVSVQGAELRIPETLPASVATLPEVRTRGTPPRGVVPPRPPADGAAPSGGSGLPPIGIAVTVTTPRPIFVRGRGVEAELGGTIRIGGTLPNPVPSGGLTLRRGTLDVLARRLTFQRGTIGFTSGTLLPVLDLAAVSRTRTATVTVRIAGTPTAPEVTFSSVPELPQDEVLSRLLFDRATSNLSPFEIAQLAQAVAELTGIASGPGAVDRLRGALALDRLGVTTDPAGRAAVEAGRYVAPGVFLGVRQGVQGQTGVGVEVELTPRLRLEGQTATGPAGDRLGLSYEWEY
jgi:translocation and assembly module TamB